MTFKHLTLAIAGLVLPILAQAQSLEYGMGQCFLSRGEVVLINDETLEETPLERGTGFTEGHTIRTGSDSSVLLLFSNGASINLKPNSSLSVSTFRQESYNPTGSFARIQADPNQSETELFLNYGGLIGEVKNLRPESSYMVRTPAGIAEVLGTVFEIEYDAETGEYSVRVGRGNVLFTPNNGNSQNFGPSDDVPPPSVSDPELDPPAGPGGTPGGETGGGGAPGGPTGPTGGGGGPGVPDTIIESDNT